MSFSTFQVYLKVFFPRIPSGHWILIGVVSLVLAVFVLTRKKSTIYESTALGLAVFIGLYLLDALALSRLGSERLWTPGIDLGSEWQRIVHGNEEHRILQLFNVAVFVPFGFFLSEFLAASKRFSSGQRLRWVTLIAFGLSLSIEILQLIFRVGQFELTDLILNTFGAFVGVVLAAACRALFVGKRA